MNAMPQKIYLNGRFLTQRTTGVQRYAAAMLKALDDLLGTLEYREGAEFILLTPEVVPNLGPFKKIKPVHVPGIPGQLWEQVTLPLATQGGVLINFCNRGPIWKTEQIVVVHDAAVVSAPAGFSVFFQTSYRAMYSILRRHARRIITVSEYSRKELNELLHVDATALDVIYPGADHLLEITADSNIQKFKLEKGNYALLVGSLQPNKNLAIVEEAFRNATLPFKIAVAGSRNHSVFRNVAGTGTGASINYLGYVSDAELRGLYENAGCYIFPSLYEGFGLPALEAMTLGCPVVSSNAASLPEVCGEAALYFDPHDPKGLRETVSRVMASAQIRQTLIQLGHKRAAQFTWKTSAQRLLQIISEMVERPITAVTPEDNVTRYLEQAAQFTPH